MDLSGGVIHAVLVWGSKFRGSGCQRVRGLRGEGGATLVETAVILPLVLILFMGIIDFGFAVADFNSLRQGDREAVRRAVVGNVSGASACPIAGSVPSADTGALVCLTKDKAGLDPASTQVAVVLDPSYTEGDALILCAQFPLHSVTGFFGGILNGRMVHSQVDMRIEKATLDIQAFAEPGAGDWAWCG